MRKQTGWLVVVIVVAGFAASSPGRRLAMHWFDSLRSQPPQAVNANFSPFTDANTNPELHQLVAQMVSSNVQVKSNEPDTAVANRQAASTAAGFSVVLPASRTDDPRLVVTGQHAVTMQIDRARLAEILKAAGHPEIALPTSLDGATVTIAIPRMVHAQYGPCPQRPGAGGAVAAQVVQNGSGPGQFPRCVRLSEGPEPQVALPSGFDLQALASTALQAAGMSGDQSKRLFSSLDWRAAMLLSLPRQLRSFQAVSVRGASGTLLDVSNRRGPGYTLLWTRDGMAYALSGYGDAADALALAESVR